MHTAVNKTKQAKVHKNQLHCLEDKSQEVGMVYIGLLFLCLFINIHHKILPSLKTTHLLLLECKPYLSYYCINLSRLNTRLKVELIIKTLLTVGELLSGPLIRIKSLVKIFQHTIYH
jgi:hypothetical protein